MDSNYFVNFNQELFRELIESLSLGNADHSEIQKIYDRGVIKQSKLDTTLL